jgi:type I restriction enzyme, S subunit
MILVSSNLDIHEYSQQVEISSILRTCDQTIEKTEALIEKYQQIKAGLMHDLFTCGIGPDGKLRPPREQAPELYQETPIGWIPKEWTPRKLKEILVATGGYLQTGPFGSQLHAHEYTQEGVTVVMPQDINEGIIEEEQIARITEPRAQSLLKHRLRKGDVIIARRGEESWGGQRRWMKISQDGFAALVAFCLALEALHSIQDLSRWRIVIQWFSVKSRA